MRGAKIISPNGRRFALVARSSSYSLIYQALPESLREPVGDKWHPINATSTPECSIGYPLDQYEQPEGLCCMVRNPIDRFASACARQKVSVFEGLELINKDVHFWTLDYMGLLQEGVTYFLFPEQINDCAIWLGLQSPVPKLNKEIYKPTLTDEEIRLVLQEYSEDHSLWTRLNSLK